jgi:hypothetical protein
VQTILTGEAHQGMLEAVKKAFKVFFGKNVRIILEEDNGETRRKR